MTLGQYISHLKKSIAQNSKETCLPIGLGNPHAWRGGYEELAFEPVENISLGTMLDEAQNAIGTAFPGYKAGEYTMSETTPIHIDHYGSWSDGELAWGFIFSLMLPQNPPQLPKPVKAPMHVFSKKPDTASLELIDGVIDIIELYEPTSPAQAQWKQSWLTKAKELLSL
jgi:hypothetical protein